MTKKSDECDEVKEDLDAAIEAVREALTQFGVDPDDWVLSVEGIKAAADSLKQVVDGLLKQDEWGEPPDEGTLADAIFKRLGQNKNKIKVNNVTVRLELKASDSPDSIERAVREIGKLIAP